MNKNVIVIALFLSACSPFVDVIDITSTDPAKLNAAAQIKTYTLGQAAPQGFTVLAPITAYSCKHLASDPPASKGNALLQLQLKALEYNAAAIVNVTFDTRGTDTWGTNCWESVTASGLAVR